MRDIAPLNPRLSTHGIAMLRQICLTRRCGSFREGHKHDYHHGFVADYFYQFPTRPLTTDLPVLLRDARPELDRRAPYRFFAVSFAGSPRRIVFAQSHVPFMMAKSNSTIGDAPMPSPTIAQQSPFPVAVESGKSYFWCACGKSSKQPFCDGSHKGSEFTPVKWDAVESKTVYFCGCKHSGHAPLCDGSHQRL